MSRPEDLSDFIARYTQVALYVQLNSQPTALDGKLEFYANGIKVISLDNINFLSSTGATLRYAGGRCAKSLDSVDFLTRFSLLPGLSSPRSLAGTMQRGRLHPIMRNHTIGICRYGLQ